MSGDRKLPGCRRLVVLALWAVGIFALLTLITFGRT